MTAVTPKWLLLRWTFTVVANLQSDDQTGTDCLAVAIISDALLLTCCEVDKQRASVCVVWTQSVVCTRTGHGEVSVCGGLDTLDTVWTWRGQCVWWSGHTGHSLDMERSVCVVVWTQSVVCTWSGHGEVSVCGGLDTLDTVWTWRGQCEWWSGHGEVSVSGGLDMERSV